MDEKEGKMGERSDRNKDGRSRLAFTKVQFIVALFVVTLLLFGSSRNRVG